MEQKIIDLLNELTIPFRRVSHPAVFTVEESKAHLEDKTPVKNLLLSEEKGSRLILVVMSGDNRLDTKALARNLTTKKLQFAKADTLLETLGVTPGSVSLFSLLNDTGGRVEVVLDEKLFKEKEVGFHPNDNTVTIFIPGDAIQTIVSATGHRSKSLDL